MILEFLLFSVSLGGESVPSTMFNMKRWFGPRSLGRSFELFPHMLLPFHVVVLVLKW